MDAFWQWLVAAGPWLVLATCALVGLAGSVLPGVPGGGLIVAGIWVFAIWTGFTWISWPTLTVTTVLALVGGLGQYAVSSYGARRFGASRWGALGAFAGFLVGMVAFPPLGGIVGAFIGATAVELWRNRGTIRQEMAAVREARLAGRKGRGVLLPAPEGDAAPHRGADDGGGHHAASPMPDAAAPVEASPGPADDDGGGAPGAAGDPDDAERPSAARSATLAGVGAVLGSVASFLFEFLFACLTVAALIAGLLL